MEYLNKLKQRQWESSCRLHQRMGCFFSEQRGDLVAALGWMAITAVLLVAISAILSGKMTGLVNSIFVKLEALLV